jgi:hypothetical protein
MDDRMPVHAATRDVPHASSCFFLEHATPLTVVALRAGLRMLLR